MTFTDCLALHKPAKRGNVTITIDAPPLAAKMQGALHGMPLNRERYVRLLVDGDTMMTDAEFERRSNMRFVERARGDCFIAGLGIGLILRPALVRCNTVTVLEVNPHVVELVAPLFPEVRVVQGDVFKYTPDQQYDTIYFDVWPAFGGDQAAEARKLARRYRPWLRPNGWMGDWASEAQRLYRRVNR